MHLWATCQVEALSPGPKACVRSGLSVRLASVTDPTGGISSYAYDPAGNRTALSLPNGVHISNAYDSLNRLTNLTQSLGATTLASYAYGLSPAGQRLRVTEADGSSIAWAYDGAYRLLSGTMRDASSAVTYQADFTYDPASNRLSQTVNGTTTTYTYNNLDQMLTAGSGQYQYDGRGNLVQVTDGANVTHYSYDAADRLTGVTLADGTAVTNVYDADGRRVQQTAGGQTTDYLWDEASPDGDVVYQTSGASSASYVLGGTELLSQTRDGVASYYLHDGQSSVRDLTNAAGAVTDTYDYSAYGDLLSRTGTTVNSYLFTGQQFEASTGLYSLRARYYDPSVGRFLSQDTANYNLTSPPNLNRYVYAANDPINRTDPRGLTALTEYSQVIEAEGEESAALESIGEEFASEAETLVGEANPGSVINPTGRGFASEIPTSWQDAEDILGKDLGMTKPNTVFKATDYGLEGDRIPDYPHLEGPDKFIADSKWYRLSTLSRDAQLRDFVQIARATGAKLWIYVCRATIVTGPALRAILSTGGNVIKYFP